MRHYPNGVLGDYTTEKHQHAGPWLSNSLPSDTWPTDEKRGWRESRSHSILSAPSLLQVKKYLLTYWPSSSPLPLSHSSGRRSPMSRILHLPKPSLTAVIPPEAAHTTRFILLCSLWYSTSALSSNTGKAIMMQFRYPVTLTFVQFGFVALYCALIMSPAIRFSRMRKPTWAIIRSTLPMGLFQVGGHIFSSMAISRIPVSTVHTIKALSPLFTVAAYALLFRVSYSAKTYFSLLPLTIGVMLACTFDMSTSNTTGLLCAFGSAVVFVSSNIFFKKLMPSPSSSGTSAPAHKLDKINLLFYSSSMAFLLMIPIWLCSDLPVFLTSSTHVSHPNKGHSTPHSVTYYFFTNGTVHFLQNIIAFVILSSTSPVTYSIASLIKRVAVICIAIMWFNQSVHPVQGFGIGMTFFGLWMYNSAKGDVEKGEKKMRRVEAQRELMLPSTRADGRMMSGVETPPNEMEDRESMVVTAETTGTGKGSKMGAVGRPRAMTLTTSQPPSRHQRHTQIPPLPTPIPQSASHGHGHLNLHINVTAPIPTKTSISRNAHSPTDSYPSPPPSLDSPPLSSIVTIPASIAVS